MDAFGDLLIGFVVTAVCAKVARATTTVLVYNGGPTNYYIDHIGEAYTGFGKDKTL